MDEIGGMGMKHLYAENSPPLIFLNNFTYAGGRSDRSLASSQRYIAETADLQR